MKGPGSGIHYNLSSLHCSRRGISTTVTPSVRLCTNQCARLRHDVLGQLLNSAARAQRHPAYLSGSKYPVYIMQQCYTEGHNEDLCPRFYPSKFNMTYNTMDSTEARACCDHEIWRLYVVFLYDWRVTIFPVGNGSPKSFESFANIAPVDHTGGWCRGFVASSLCLPTPP